ncbi:MAG: efflux RND transporter periplasmic adaptor subunit [Candidatus Hydrogenedentota bacterium]
MNRRIAYFAAALALAAMSGCIRLGSESDAKTDAPRKPPVIIIPVEASLAERGSISSFFETVTRVEAERKVEIIPEGVGVCLKTFVEEGDLVKRGDILAELDKSEVEVALQGAQTQLLQSKMEFDRATMSKDKGLISQAEYDLARFKNENAAKQVESHQVQLDNLTIRAPIDGVVTTRNIQQGMLVSSGRPAFMLVEPDSYVLNVNVPERELPRLKIGQVAEVNIDALADEMFMAAVRRINPGVDAATGTVKVVLDFDDATRARLREANFARVKLIMETREDALLAPKEAIIEENTRKYVFVVKPAPAEAEEEGPVPTEDEGTSGKEVLAEAVDDAAEVDKGPVLAGEKVEVTTGFEDSTQVEIVGGIDDKALIVTNGQYTLKQGSRIRVTNVSEEIMKKAGLSLDQLLSAAEEHRKGHEDDGRERGMHIDIDD